MSKIVTDRQDELVRWLCERIGYTPTPSIRAIGSVGSDNVLHGVVGFDGFNGASCQMHVAGDPGWVNRAILHAAFDYPFNFAGCSVVLGVVPSGNAEALRFNERLGFRTVAVIPEAHPDGALVVMAMDREECRWLDRPHAVH